MKVIDLIPKNLCSSDKHGFISIFESDDEEILWCQNCGAVKFNNLEMETIVNSRIYRPKVIFCDLRSQ